MLGLGLASAALTAAAIPLLVERFLEVPAPLHEETATAFFVLACTVPLFTVTVGLRAVLEAFQEFRTVNIVRIPVSVFFFFGPLAVLPFADNLAAVVVILAVGRLVEFVMYLRICLRLFANQGCHLRLSSGVLGPLLKTSGWLAVSSIIGPVMVYFDRFLIGSLISLAAVAYYTTPYDVVTRLLVIPGSLLGVLFPAMATVLAADRARGAQLLTHGAKSVLLALAPAVLIIIPLADVLLALWLGEDFATRSASALQWLTVGVLVNALAYIPLAYVQAAGRPDLTAKLHMLEIVPYLLLLWWLAGTHGIAGVAIAWTMRTLFDTLVLFYLAGRISPETRGAMFHAFLILGIVLSVSGIGVLFGDGVGRIVYVACAVLAFLPFSWLVIMRPGEREFFARYFRPAQP